MFFLFFRKWNFLALRLKNFLYFFVFWETNFLYFRKCNLLASSYLVHFLSPSSKKKILPNIIPYISGSGSFGCNIKRFLIFSQKKAFLMFWVTKTRKNFLYFKRELSNSKNEKIPPLKCFLYFQKWNFPVVSLKNLLYFRKELIETENQTKNLPRRSFLLFVTVL